MSTNERRCEDCGTTGNGVCYLAPTCHPCRALRREATLARQAAEREAEAREAELQAWHDQERERERDAAAIYDGYRS